MSNERDALLALEVMRDASARADSSRCTQKESREQWARYDAAERIVSEALAAPAEGGQEEWQTVPKVANQLVIQSIQTQTGMDATCAQHFWDKLLYWASTPPAEGGQPAWAVLPAMIVDRKYDSHAPILDRLPDGTKLYTTPPAPSAVAVDEAKLEIKKATIALLIAEIGDEETERARKHLDAAYAALTAALGSAGGVEGAIEDSREAGSAYASASALANHGQR